eukprot:3655361-Amphidinium_carterae.1
MSKTLKPCLSPLSCFRQLSSPAEELGLCFAAHGNRAGIGIWQATVRTDSLLHVGKGHGVQEGDETEEEDK